MPLAEATAILRHVPTVLPYAPDADVAALGQLAECCEQFSPFVGWKTLTSKAIDAQTPWFGESPGHLFCDVSGVAGLFGGEESLAATIVATFREMRLTVHVAITESLGASWALARSEQACTVVPPGGLAAALGPLPITRLRLADDVIGILRRLGLQTIDQLSRLPRDGLAERFGTELLLRLDQALGTASEVIVPYRPVPQYEAACDLEYPTARRDLLDRLIVQLIERIVPELVKHGVGMLQLVGRFSCRGEPVTFEVGFYRPTQAVKQITDLLCLQLDGRALSAPVRRIELRVERTAAMTVHTGQFFANDADAAPEFAALMERLSSRLGTRAILRPTLVADPIPERAYRYVPAIGGRLSGSRRGPSAVSHRPLRLFSPVSIEVECSSNGPKAIRRQHWQEVSRCWGPERIETGWWRQGLVRRDYYRVEICTGSRFWIFHDLREQTWYLHGSFE
jgi:protein ImuB